MAVVNSKSTQVTNQDAGLMSPAYSGKGQTFSLFFDALPTAGDANSTVAIAYLPPGKYRYLGHESRIYHSAFGTARTLDVGWDAYTNEDGTAVVADEDGIHSAADVSVAGSFQPQDELLTHPVGTKVFDSRDGILFRIKVEGGALSAGEEVSGYMTFLG